MRAYLTDLVRAAATPPEARLRVREYLQVRILDHLQRLGAMTALAFQGGTALRLLYGLARFSEDLDFALEHPHSEVDLPRWLHTLSRRLRAEGYPAELRRVRLQRTVASAFVHFPGLLYELGLSSHPDESLSVKIEVDTRPPAGATTRTTLVRRHDTLLHVYHHDRASLLAGKIHALLQRRWLKGRDVYDLVWMLSEPTWPEPNISLLQHALEQTGWQGPPVTASTWRRRVRERLQAADWAQVRRDAAPFLEDAGHGDYLTPQVVMAVLGE